MSRWAGCTFLESTLTLVLAGVITFMPLQSVEAANHNLPPLSDTTFTVRVFQAAGTVCSVETHDSATRVGISEMRGAFSGGLSSSDSVIVFDASSDRWRTARLAGFWLGDAAWGAAPVGGGTPACYRGDSSGTEPRPQASLELDALPSVLERIQTGAPVQAFRSIEYGVLQWEGDWWLGQREDRASDWELLTGPLFPPGPGGIEVSYLKEDGSIATDESEVRTVEVFLWTRDRPHFRDPASKDRPKEDHMRIRIYLRAGTASQIGE